MKSDLSHKFKVPNGYFDQMEKEILAKTTGVTSQVKIVPFYQKRIFQYAASIAALLIITFAVWMTGSSDNTITPQDEIAAKEVIYDVYFDDEITSDEFTFEDEVLYADFISEQE